MGARKNKGILKDQETGSKKAIKTLSKKAEEFFKYWETQKGSEISEYSKFWLSFLQDVFDVENPVPRIFFQVPVKIKGKRRPEWIDAWIPETKVLIEQKSRGKKLDAPQPNHNNQTPYEQAKYYDNNRPHDQKARWIITCNFDELWIYDCNAPIKDPEKIKLNDLPSEINRLSFIVDKSIDEIRVKEKELSFKAGKIIGELYEKLRSKYEDPDSEDTLKFLNRLCVRLVFILYAEDSGVFQKYSFLNLIEKKQAIELHSYILWLFRILNTPEKDRDPYLEPALNIFPYTNGGLFEDVLDIEIPPIDEEIKNLLIESSNFNWSNINPTIFGAVFESTLDPKTRRKGGMVYTSVDNIHKVIDPLFLNDLKKEWESIKSYPVFADRRIKAKKFQEKLASLSFLDPACGSGNFLTETYICLRRLENDVIKISEAMEEGEAQLSLDDLIKVKMEQFHGIEIDDFAVSVAKTALWIAEIQMRHETAKIMQLLTNYLPLKNYDGIVEANALKIDWPSTSYIMGNPPFIGARMMAQGSDQKNEIESLFGKIKDVQDLDYVCGWYYKAAEAINGTTTKVAFVSTNSITQGAQVPILWKVLLDKFKISIDFAWRSFKWDSEASEKVSVYCVIIGFSNCGTSLRKIFDDNGFIECNNINPYLEPENNLFVTAQKEAICQVPKMSFGNQPRGGFLILSEEEALHYSKDPLIKKWIRPYIGADEFVSGKKRFCLWLKDAKQSEIEASKFISERVKLMRDFRSKSKGKTTRNYANTPHKFAQITQPDDENYLLVPGVSTGNRLYIPLGFMDGNSIASNLVMIVPGAGLYHFGVMSSSTHMAWMRRVCGCLGNGYRYSKEIVYNTFPWPSSKPNQIRKIIQTAQKILEVRKLYSDISLNILYNPSKMPRDLISAHKANDKAVLEAYGLPPDTSESAIVEHLFKLYLKLTREK